MASIVKRRCGSALTGRVRSTRLKSHEPDDGARHAGGVHVSGLCLFSHGRTKHVSAGRPATRCQVDDGESFLSRPRISSVPSAGDSNSRGPSLSSSQARWTGAAGNLPKFVTRCRQHRSGRRSHPSVRGPGSMAHECQNEINVSMPLIRPRSPVVRPS